MMIMDVAPKDIHVTIDLTATEIRYLTLAMEHSAVKYDGKEEPEMIQAAHCLDEFYRMLSDVKDGLPKHSAA
jgi:hypothetical protein